jgi:ADP-ribose pyrophosphatase
VTPFQPIASEVKWRGAVIAAGVARFRYSDGDEVTRDAVWHPGAVGIIPIDGEHVWLTRQPREVAGLTASLEIPAGKRDVEGESSLQTAKRELAEEIGKQADAWEELKVFYTSPGFSDELVWLFLARGLSDARAAQADEDERIEIIRWPLDRLDQAFAESEDSKTLIALAWLAQARERGQL